MHFMVLGSTDSLIRSICLSLRARCAVLKVRADFSGNIDLDQGDTLNWRLSYRQHAMTEIEDKRTMAECFENGVDVI